MRHYSKALAKERRLCCDGGTTGKTADCVLRHDGLFSYHPLEALLEAGYQVSAIVTPRLENWSGSAFHLPLEPDSGGEEQAPSSPAGAAGATKYSADRSSERRYHSGKLGVCGVPQRDIPALTLTGPTLSALPASLIGFRRSALHPPTGQCECPPFSLAG